jgi:sugar lactone lactonase YvrE
MPPGVLEFAFPHLAALKRATRSPISNGMRPLSAFTRGHLRITGLGCLILTLAPLLSAGSNPTPTVSFLGISNSLNTASAFTLPSGVAVDALGDIFVVDQSTHAISKIVAVNGSIPASPTIQTLSITISGGSSPFVPNAPKNMASDASGNLFVVCSNGLWEITAASGYTTASELADISFQGVAADSAGNLFVTNAGVGRVMELTAPNYALSTIINGLNTPLAVAVDASDDVFVADQSGASIKEFANSSGSYPSGTVLVAAGSAHGLAIDAGGNLIISDFDNGLFELPAFTNYSSEITLSSGFTSALGVAVAPNGNIVSPHWTAGSLGPGVYQIVMNPNFGSSSLGTHTATSLTLPFQVASGITISSVKVLTLGAANLDFKKGSSSTCANGTTNTTCNVVANFLPLAAGLRRGALVINSTDGSNTYTTTVALYGMADAPQATFMPGAASVLTGSAGIWPYQIALDGSGNVYETDQGGDVYRIPAGGGTASALTPWPVSMRDTTGLAMDGAGNLYVYDVDSGQLTVASPAANSTGGAWVLPITGASLGTVYGLAIDGAGNLYVADCTNAVIVKIAIQNPGTGLVSGIATDVPMNGYRAGCLAAVAVDNAGNIYAADEGNSVIVRITPAGAATALTLPNSIALGEPYGVRVDGFGNVYITDSGNNRIIEQTTAGVTQVIPIPAALTPDFPFDAAVDSAGKIYISDYDNGRILVVDSTAPVVPAFALTNAGQTSSDSPQDSLLINIGDRNLGFTGLSYPASFPENSSDGNLCSMSVPLAPGAACDVSINFIPEASGSLSANLQLTDNNLNAPAATQAIAVSGTGAAVGTATTLLIAPDPAVAGQPTTFTGTVSPAPLGSATVKFYNHGSTLIGSASVISGTATLVTSSLTAGTLSVTAAFQGNSGFNSSASGAQNLTVSQGSISTHISLTTSPNPVYAGEKLTMTATITPAPAGVSPGTVKFYSGSTLLGTVTVNASGVATLTVSTLPSGAHSMTAEYSGNAAFASSTSTARSQTVNAAYTVSPAKTQYSLSPGGSLQITVNVPPLGGDFDEKVSMSASGLPPGTTASFDPPSVTPGSKGAATVFTVSPSPASSLPPENGRGTQTALLASLLGVCALVSLGKVRNQSKSLLGIIWLGALIAAMIAISSCGTSRGPASSTVQPGSYTVTITGSSGSLERSSTVTVVVE